VQNRKLVSKGVQMAIISVVNIEATSFAGALCAAAEKLDGDGIETVLDCSSLSRIDTACLRALQEFACVAVEKQRRVILRGLNEGVYKALKLAKLTPNFSFLD
jgi:anti-anti-sigma regulatory factor